VCSAARVLKSTSKGKSKKKSDQSSDSDSSPDDNSGPLEVWEIILIVLTIVGLIGAGIGIRLYKRYKKRMK
jgi:hypothetical protein